DVSKSEAGKLSIEVADVDLRTMLEEVVDLMAPGAHQKGLELTAHLDPGSLAHLRADEGRVRQVLTNLVGNAVKFTDEGEIAVRGEVVHETPEAVTVRLSVRDTGIGIPADRQRAVFESFTQADNSTTRRYGGTGRGPATCQPLITPVGAALWR